MRFTEDIKEWHKQIHSTMPLITELGDGTYFGIVSGWVFNFKGKEYALPFGIRGINSPMNITINGEEVTR